MNIQIGLDIATSVSVIVAMIGAIISMVRTNRVNERSRKQEVSESIKNRQKEVLYDKINILFEYVMEKEKEFNNRQREFSKANFNYERTKKVKSFLKESVKNSKEYLDAKEELALLKIFFGEPLEKEQIVKLMQEVIGNALYDLQTEFSGYRQAYMGLGIFDTDEWVEIFAKVDKYAELFDQNLAPDQKSLRVLNDVIDEIPKLFNDIYTNAGKVFKNYLE